MSADYKCEENKLDKETILPIELASLRPEYIYLAWSSRDCVNSMFYFIYRSVMVLHNSVWYYFAPFLWKFLTIVWVLKKNASVTELINEGREGAEGAEGGEGGEAVEAAGGEE